VVGLGQAEAADHSPVASLRQVFLLAPRAELVIGTITSDDCTLIIER
jgi:hypothetical protein